MCRKARSDARRAQAEAEALKEEAQELREKADMLLKNLRAAEDDVCTHPALSICCSQGVLCNRGLFHMSMAGLFCLPLYQLLGW